MSTEGMPFYLYINISFYFAFLSLIFFHFIILKISKYDPISSWLCTSKEDLSVQARICSSAYTLKFAFLKSVFRALFKSAAYLDEVNEA